MCEGRCSQSCWQLLLDGCLLESATHVLCNCFVLCEQQLPSDWQVPLHTSPPVLFNKQLRKQPPVQQDFACLAIVPMDRGFLQNSKGICVSRSMLSGPGAWLFSLSNPVQLRFAEPAAKSEKQAQHTMSLGHKLSPAGMQADTHLYVYMQPGGLERVRFH